MKKILFVTRPLCPPWDEASKNFAYQLAKNITQHDVTILTCQQRADLPKNITQKKIYTAPQFSARQKMRALIFQMHATRRFDIAHYFFTPTKQNDWLIRCIPKGKTKTVQTIATLREDLYTPAELKKLFFGDVVVTYSDYAMKRIQALGFTHQVQRIYPGIDTEYFAPADKDAALMHDYGINADDFVVLWPGEYTRLGATDMIVEALQKLFQNGQNQSIKFIFACRIKSTEDQRKKQEAQSVLTQAGVMSTVIFIDSCADMAKLYNLSDVVAFPVADMHGKFDVPLSVIEAYACAKPVILSALPLFAEFSHEGISAIIPRGNPAAFADTITVLAHDRQKCLEIGKNARAYACENFNIKNSAAAYERLYEQL